MSHPKGIGVLHVAHQVVSLVNDALTTVKSLEDIARSANNSVVHGLFGGAVAHLAIAIPQTFEPVLFRRVEISGIWSGEDWLQEMHAGNDRKRVVANKVNRAALAKEVSVERLDNCERSIERQTSANAGRKRRWRLRWRQPLLFRINLVTDEP